MLRFHLPLIEPDVRICRIRLSDKAFMRSLTRQRVRLAPEPQQPQRLVQVLVREA
jgi:hypothetical protein